jgi:DEAD/DEAH box helicase domain-containing protein
VKTSSHQAEAIEAIHQGKDIVIVTPTASGKTLCYNVPVLNSKLSSPVSKALYLFPTKALSQDQMFELQNLIDSPKPVPTYEATLQPMRARPFDARMWSYEPDMLHTAILPHHTKWMSFFQNLKFVVIDELHSYRGVFGSHMTNVLRRLDRICRFYGSKPQFICCSATIANPKELAEKLLEREVLLIDRSGAPSSEKVFIFYNPPVVNKELGLRESHVNAARRLASPFIKEGIQTILFTTSRLQVEVLTKYLKDRYEKRLEEKGMIRGYRGGYLPLVRREIEKAV